MAITMHKSAINLYLKNFNGSQLDSVKTVSDIKKFVMA
jgi:hypothetical protein